MKAKSLLAAAALALVCTTGHAQQHSLVGGTWIHSEDVPDFSHPGNVIHSKILAKFSPDGQLAVTMAVADGYESGAQTTIYRYRMTGPASYSEVAVDYSSRQLCSAVCLPTHPMIPMGTRANCDFSFNGNLFVTINCQGNQITYSRHWMEVAMQTSETAGMKRPHAV